MEKISEGIKNIIKYNTYILFLLITIWLVAISGFSTSYINIDTERTYFVPDNVLFNLLACIVFGLMVYCGRKYITNNGLTARYGQYFVYVRKILIFGIGILGLIIVLSCNTMPRADQLQIMNAAYGLSQGDYTMFAKGGYMQMCQNQNGIVVFIYFLSILFGSHNYITFQILNVLSLVLIYEEIMEIVKYLGMGMVSQLAVLVFGIVFLPLMLYTTFVYGTIISLAFSIVALRYELLYFKNFKWHELIMSCLAIAFSVMIKSNSLIFMIAMIIYAIAKMVEKHRSKAIIFIITAVLLYFIQSISVSSFIEFKTGQVMDKGISSWAYIAMGLQEGYKSDGWWNRYNSDTYHSNDCDAEKQAEEAKAYIKERLKYFMENKEYAVRFLGHKLASQWNNPTFQGFWIINMQTSNIKQPEWVKSMHSVKGQEQLGRILNLMQFIIVGGSLIFLIFDSDKTKLDWILLQLVFVGGFLFHAFWEAKCQYTLPYFMLLIPMALKGYSDIGRVVDMNKKTGNGQYRNKIVIFMVLFIGSIVFDQMSNSTVVKGLIKIDDNADEYEQYLIFNTTDKIKDGNYSISTFEEEMLSIACINLDGEKKATICLMPGQQDNIHITTQDDKVYFQFIHTALYMDLRNNEEIENGLVQAYEKNDTDAQRWVIKKDKENQDTYYILIGKQSALSYDRESERVCIRKLDYNNDQKWIIK